MKKKTAPNILEKLWRTIPFHTVFVAAYPVLALMAHSLLQVAPIDGCLSLGISLALALVLLILLQLIIKDWQRAALAASLLVILFFLYGHIYIVIKGFGINGFYPFHHRTLLLIWAVVGVGGLWFFARRPLPLDAVTSVLNITTLFLVVMPLAQILMPTLTDSRRESQMSLPVEIVQAPIVQPAPDIYYIILDAHGRTDILKQYSGYDDSAFIKSLEGLGFYVGKCSQSNYALTLLSLSASLNFAHLDNFKDENGGLDYLSLIEHSAIRRFLEAQGYKTVAFATGFRMTQLTDADLYYAPPRLVGDKFEIQLLDTTLWGALTNVGLFPRFDMTAENDRNRTLLALNTLRQLPDVPGPKFVFAHIVSPHEPYIFDAQGNFHDVDFGQHSFGVIPLAKMSILYRGQVQFIENQILDIVRTILAKSPTPPIIIIQGDHGPLVKDPAIRMPILNAYYLPNSKVSLYPTISPVNSFRVVLNAYFGQALSLVEDDSHYSEDYAHPFIYLDVPNNCAP